MDKETRQAVEDFIEKYADKAVWQVDELLIKFIEELLKKKDRTIW